MGTGCFMFYEEYNKPNANCHSLIELLYHMITWADFTKKQLEKDQNMDPAFF